ncbi:MULTISPECIES: hypothetical protein [unclassified Microcoleus]|uniref:hypothetical protein n=2 Tax=Microcoleus TaxID=44471 RepID=UPI004040B037
MSQSPMISQGMDKGAVCEMNFLVQEFLERDTNGGDGSALVPTIDRGRETALPSPPYHVGAAGIDMNPLAGKSKLQLELLKIGQPTTSSFNPLAGTNKLRL